MRIIALLLLKSSHFIYFGVVLVVLRVHFELVNYTVII